MQTTITDYAMRESFAFYSTPKQEEKFDPREIDFLLDNLLANIPEEGTFSDGFVLEYKSNPLTPEDAFGMIATQLPRIRIEAIRLFEDYFQKGTDIQKLLSDYEAGEELARKTMRYIGIFPVEAMNVRTELANPRLMELRAAQQEDQRSMIYLRRVMGPFLVGEIEGPHLPPMSLKKVIEHMQTAIPQVDQLARSIVANGGADLKPGH